MFQTIISFIRRKIFRIDKYRWDHQYNIGQWDDLRTKEMLRLNTAKDFLNKYVLDGNILEIGCGEGVFFQNAVDVNYSFYEGIDLSTIAIERIQKTDKSQFLSADMENYIPTHFPFTVIVLNEVLYYSKNPINLLNRYSQYLSKKGVFLIGMFDTKKSKDIWNSSKLFFDEIESIKIEQDGKLWNYKI